MKDIIGKQNAGYTVISAVQYPHPADAHLYIVLCQRGENEYVVWTHNTQDGGFFWGHYFGHSTANNRIEAFDAFLETINARIGAYVMIQRAAKEKV